MSGQVPSVAGRSLRTFTTICDSVFCPVLAPHGFTLVERHVSAHLAWHVYRNGDRHVRVTATTHPLDASSCCEISVGQGPYGSPEGGWIMVALWQLAVTSGAPTPTGDSYPLRDVAELGDVLRRMSADLERDARDFLAGDLRRLRAAHAAQTYPPQPPTVEGPVVRTLTSADGTRRVQIFQRDRDATFGFEESRWDAEDQCWIPSGPRSVTFTDTLDRAISEAHGRVSWLGEPSRDAIEDTDA